MCYLCGWKGPARRRGGGRGRVRLGGVGGGGHLIVRPASIHQWDCQSQAWQSLHTAANWTAKGLGCLMGGLQPVARPWKELSSLPHCQNWSPWGRRPTTVAERKYRRHNESQTLPCSKLTLLSNYFKWAFPMTIQKIYPVSLSDMNARRLSLVVHGMFSVRWYAPC